MKKTILILLCALLALSALHKVEGQNIPFTDDQIDEFSRSVVLLLVQTTEGNTEQGVSIP